jgi:putative ABC transport system substrate-binding protein
VNYAANVKLITEVFGGKARIGMLYNPNEANSVFALNTMKSLLQGAQAQLIPATVAKESDVARAAAELAKGVDVIFVGGDNTVAGAIAAVLKAAKDKKVPVFAGDSGSIAAGAIAGVSVDYKKLGRLTAEVVGQVLAGGEPRTIPRVTLSGDRLIVNASAAKNWPFQLPAGVIQKADEVIRSEPRP